MAGNRSINSLDNTRTLSEHDLLVLWKSSVNKAYNISGGDFTAMLANMADGHGGIASISWTTSGTSGDGQYHNGTITYADGTTSSVQFRDGVKGNTGAQTYVWVKYAMQEPTSNADVLDYPAPWMGIYAGTSSTAPTAYTSYTWYEIKGDKGDTGDGITSIVRTDGTGEPGSTDVYTVYAGETAVGTVDIYQGLNGDGAVNTINGLYPDGNGNVELVPSDVRQKALTSRNILLLGDSYNNGQGGTIPRGWGYYFNQQNGTNATIIQQSGGGFVVPGWTDAQYPNLTYADVIDTLDVSANYDLVIAQAGWNDANEEKNPSGGPAIATGVADFVTAVNSKWPRAEIVIIPTYHSNNIVPQKEACMIAMADAAFDNNARSSSQSFLWLKGQGYTATDNTHLTDAGYQALARYITRFVKGWDGVVARPHVVNTRRITVTTDANGAANLATAVTSADTVVAVRCTNVTSAMCVPWCYSSGSNYWWAWVQNWSNRSFFNNTSVTLDVTYIVG